MFHSCGLTLTKQVKTFRLQKPTCCIQITLRGVRTSKDHVILCGERGIHLLEFLKEEKPSFLVQVHVHRHRERDRITLFQFRPSACKLE